jgi:aldehyde:ferredoxin oxidoreductase
VKVLVVDLTHGDIREQAIDPAYSRDFIGGSGLGVRLLWDLLDPNRDPLDPASPLLWISGPLTGTGGPTNGRSTICARSPQTGLWGESNIGGFVGSELRYAGYDGVLITGRASGPVYLWIHNGKAELRDAAHVWGRADTYETQRIVKSEVGEPMARVACIGLAGENGVPYASIMSDHGRLAGRTGMGTLMGSKNLKAIAVRGTGKIPLARDDEYKRLRVEINKVLVDETLTAVLRQTGTSGNASYFELLGDMPQKYWTQGTFEGAERISGAVMAETILTGKKACQGCVIACGRAVTINEGSFRTGGEVKGPEYETVCSFGSQLLVDDLAAITALGNRCDEVGIDTISAGNTIALAYLMFERGIITAADTGGFELRWGDPRPCFELIQQIARREGFGALLARGSQALAAHFGVEDLAAHIHNLEVPMHDPRGLSGMALVYVTSPRGACHNQSDYFMVELGSSVEELDIPMTDRLHDAGKARFVVRHQDWRTVCNSLVMCLYANTLPSTVVKLLGAATGHDWSLEEMMLAGERAWNLKRMFNCRLGLTRAGEKLPKLLLEPLPDGGTEGHVPDVELMLKEYYQVRGWDQATGAPTQRKLKELELEKLV